MAVTRVVINRANLQAILKRDTAPHLKRLADRVAASAVGQAGQIDGEGVTAKRYDQPTPNRARSAIVLHHPTPAGRKAARAAALAAMRTAGGVL